MRRYIKGSLIASFILTIISTTSAANELVEQALAKQLDQDPAWKALLHIEEGSSHIQDENFILSSKKFSAKEELIKTILILFNNPYKEQAICKFPARYQWLSSRLPTPHTNYDQCPEFKQFLQQAPADTISVVYSSENLTQPSSMMGHVLLKIAGNNHTSQYVEHGVSFFTEVNGINIPKLIFDSMVFGKQGYFALSPYHENLFTYLKEEQRNIWEYELDLDDKQKQLIQAHIWELKHANLDYFFQDYNCATLLKFLIAVADPKLLDTKDKWTTPIDLVKAVNNTGIVRNVSVIPSSKWKMRMLSEALNININTLIKSSVLRGEIPPLDNAYSPQQTFLALELASNYSDYLYESGSLPLQTWKTVNQKVQKSKSESQNQYSIDLSNYKNPLKTPPDSQVYTGLVHEERYSKLKIGFLPTSHRLEDDNRQFFSENELRLGDVSFVISSEEDKVEIDEFQLYAVSSLIPRETFSGGLSGRFRLGIEGHYDQQLERKNVGNASGAIGLGYRLSTDAFTYALIGGGYGFTKHESYLYTNPEIGLVVNEVFDMKTIASVQNVWNQLSSGNDYYSFQLKQSKYINENYSVVLGFDHRRNEAYSENRFEFLFKYFF